MNWEVVTGYIAYCICASNRQYKDLDAELGWGYNNYLHYKYYAQLRWQHRGEG